MRGIPKAVAQGFMIVFLGMFFGYVILFMNEKGILIDEITSSTLPAWELAFIVVFAFIIIGMFVIMLGGIRK